MILAAVTAALLVVQPVDQVFQRKARLGEAAFAAEADAAVAALIDRATMTGQCATPGEISAAAQLALARRTADPIAFARTKAAADAALAQREQLRLQYLDGQPALPPYGLVARTAARAKAETDPRRATLYRRMAQDQFARIDSVTLRPFFGPGAHTAWEKGLDEAALAYVDVVVSGEWCPLDVANAAWLKADLAAHGWYRISIHGSGRGPRRLGPRPARPPRRGLPEPGPGDARTFVAVRRDPRRELRYAVRPDGAP